MSLMAKFAKLKKLLPLVMLAVFGLALWCIDRSLQGYRYADVMKDLHAISWARLGMALGFTACSYLMLTGYDTLAFRHLRIRLPWRRIALTSFTSCTFANNSGMGMLVGGSLRYRLYSVWNISGVAITQVIAFSGLTFWIGLATVSGTLFLVHPLEIPPSLHLPFHSIHLFGMVLAGISLSYLVACIWHPRPVRLFGIKAALPRWHVAVGQLVVSSVDWMCSAAALWVLLPAGTVSYPTLLGAFLLAQMIGVISHVPGGLGVFETVMLVFLTPFLPASTVLGTLLVFRMVYYLVPLASVAGMWSLHGLLHRRDMVKKAARATSRWLPLLTPTLAALAVFVAGIVLLFSGVTPGTEARLHWLGDLLPLAVLETSHFLGSIAGIALILLAHGLHRRLNVAYHLVQILLAAGAAFSLLKGLEWETAAFLGGIALLLIPGRRQFRRRAVLFANDQDWLLAAALVMAAVIWLGFFSYRHVEYKHELWWRFALDADAPRFLRAEVGVLVVLAGVALARLLRPAPARPARPGPAEIALAAAVVATSPDTSASLALLGDKPLLFSASNQAFLMYGVSGSVWVAMGDPVGNPDDARELAWRFRELADQHGATPAFYEVGADHLPLYLDLGRALFKIGEEARVPVQAFSLDGHSRKSMRRLCSLLEKEGYVFEIVPLAAVPGLLPQLRQVSDAWMAAKHTREKAFSLGCFDPAYLSHFPIAVIRKDNVIQAFANLWTGAGKIEFSIDLMRFQPGAANGLMDYLIIRLLQWGKDNGYQWFNLGMAPLAGLENRALAPLWPKVGSVLFRHGEHFYNFRGLHQYKQKFDPEWHPKYLACPGGLAIAHVLPAIATLVSGSIKGIVSK
jgi:phosphatidylglycerol lysyltransferase